MENKRSYAWNRIISNRTYNSSNYRAKWWCDSIHPQFGTSRDPKNVKIWPGGNILSASEYALPAKVQSTHLPSQVPQPTLRSQVENLFNTCLFHLYHSQMLTWKISFAWLTESQDEIRSSDFFTNNTFLGEATLGQITYLGEVQIRQCFQKGFSVHSF